MGCQTSNVLDFRVNAEERIIESTPRDEKDSIQNIIEKQKNEFPDMPEWEGERYKGIGIKRMKGYKCTLQIDKLNQKREEFWNLRNAHGAPNYKTWRIINQACVYDEYRANVLMEEYKFKIEENIEKVDLKLNLYEVATNKTTIIETNNLVNGAELKKIFCEKNNISMDEYNIRMFFAGNEIANEHFIYQYHIKNDFKIQVLKSAKVTTNN